MILVNQWSTELSRLCIIISIENSLNEIFERIPRHFKEEFVPGTLRIPTLRHMESFLEKYGVIFKSKPPIDFEEDLTFKDIKDGFYDLEEIIQDVDEVSLETLEDITKRLEKLHASAKELCEAKREQRNFQELAPDEDSLNSDDHCAVIDI